MISESVSHLVLNAQNIMSIKLFVFLCLLSVALAGFLPYYQPSIVKYIQPAIQAAPEAPANYEFSYEVNEPSTGDVKNQQESAKNGAISGVYSLNDADGFKRTVKYTADDVNGFRADVQRTPLANAPGPIIIKKIIAVPSYNPWAYQAW